MLLCSNLDGSVLVIINVVFAANLYSIYVYAFYQFFSCVFANVYGAKITSFELLNTMWYYSVEIIYK